MQVLKVEVALDHIDCLSRAKKPILGLAELIWNSVDADATQVTEPIMMREALSQMDRAANERGQTLGAYSGASRS